MGRQPLKARYIRVAVAVFCSGLTAAVQGQNAYDAIVAPIFRARCVACHGAEKQKGKLALHTWERVEQGGDSGPLLVRGKPAESELLRRLRLPLDDEEHMPPRDEPQPAREEMALLERWISQGGTSAVTVDKLELPAELAQLVPRLREILPDPDTASRSALEPAWQLDPAAVTRARAPLAAKVAELQRRFPGALNYESRTSAALHFTAAPFGREFGNAELSQLASLGEAVVSLEISGTAVTDEAASTLTKFPALRVLRLAYTAVTDASVPTIATLSKLEAVVLSATNVTGAAVGELKKLPALRRLHLARGEATDAARAAGLPLVESGVDALAVPASEAAAPRS